MEIAARKTYYRVRPLVAKEQVVPDEIKSACFDNRQAAELFALNMLKLSSKKNLAYIQQDFLFSVIVVVMDYSIYPPWFVA